MTQPPTSPYGDPSGVPSFPQQPMQPYPGQPAPQSYPGQPAPAYGATQPLPAQPYPAQPYPAQPYPAQPYPGQADPQSYPGQPAYGAPSGYGTQPPGGAPYQLGPSGTPPKKPANLVLYVIIGVLALALIVGAVWFFALRDKGGPVTATTSSSTAPPVTSSSALPATTTAAPPPPTTTEPPATSTTTEPPTTTVTPPPVGDLGLVTLDDTFTDDGVKVTITVQQATTTWIPAMPQWGDPSLDGLYVRMVGFRVKTDLSKSPYLGMGTHGSNFTLVTADGTKIDCSDLLTSDKYKQYSDAILAALGADKAFDTDYSTDIGEGWFICQTPKYKDAAANTPGYTLHYTRGAGTLKDGTVIPEFTHDTVVKAP